MGRVPIAISVSSPMLAAMVCAPFVVQPSAYALFARPTSPGAVRAATRQWRLGQWSELGDRVAHEPPQIRSASETEDPAVTSG